MKLDNKSDYSINFTRKALNTISKHADLNKPEEGRMFIALLKTSNDVTSNQTLFTVMLSEFTDEQVKTSMKGLDFKESTSKSDDDKGEID